MLVYLYMYGNFPILDPKCVYILGCGIWDINQGIVATMWWRIVALLELWLCDIWVNLSFLFSVPLAIHAFHGYFFSHEKVYTLVRYSSFSQTEYFGSSTLSSICQCIKLLISSLDNMLVGTERTVFCASFKMRHFVRVASVILVILANAGVQTNRLVHLQLFRIERGLRSTSGIVMTTELQSVSACVLFGSSLEKCHAVNYDTSMLLCEVISTHGSLLEMQNNSSSVFAAINNTNDILDTGVGSICVQGPVQWKEQAILDYIALENVVHCDEASGRSCVCKVTIGDNEIPGVVDNDRRCHFVYKDLTGKSSLYRTLTMDPESGLAAAWVSYRIGDDVPGAAFIGGHLSPGTPLYVCRAPVNGVQYAGYYNPNTGLAYVHSDSVHYPTVVDLLFFSPSGPTFVGPTVDWPCPRYHVQIASHSYDYIEHYGRKRIPSWAVTSGNQYAVGESGPTFIKPDQRNPWIKDQLWNDLLSTILHLQLPNFVSCGRDKPSHMTQNLVTVGVKL